MRASAIAIALCGIAMATPVQASYNECVVQQETELANRPDGITMPRWPILEKGAKAVPRDVSKGWTFVLHFDEGKEIYGWMPSKVLGGCKVKDGTP